MSSFAKSILPKQLLFEDRNWNGSIDCIKGERFLQNIKYEVLFSLLKLCPSSLCLNVNKDIFKKVEDVSKFDEDVSKMIKTSPN